MGETWRGWFKCNTDGASRGNLEEGSAAFCLRNANGDLIYDEARRLEVTNNLCAEAIAIQEGVRFCIEQQRIQVLIESNSLSMIYMIEDRWDTPWKIRMEMEKIKYWRSKGIVHFAHILREGNALANLLDNEVFSFVGTKDLKYSCFQEIPLQARRLLNIDKQQISQLRFNTFRNRDQVWC